MFSYIQPIQLCSSVGWGTYNWLREGSRLMTTKPSPSPSILVLSYSPSISSEVFKGLVQRIAPDISSSCRHIFFVLIYPSQLVSIRHSCSCLLKGCFGKISLCTGKQHLSLPLVSSCIMKASDLSSEAIICPMWASFACSKVFSISFDDLVESLPCIFFRCFSV